ncbi:MAG TPA: hypothetical protein VEA78_08295 [Acidimicrobiales bacterium]|nr:hypothetical protein [Acidimicrobiales bacterium]
MHLRLDELVGPELAAGMVTAYPPFDWHQVALKSDLLAMEERLTDRFEGVLHREIHAAITSQTRTLFFGFVSTIIAVVGAMVALVDLSG